MRSPGQRGRGHYLAGLTLFVVAVLAGGAYAISMIVQGAPAYPVTVIGTPLYGEVVGAGTDVRPRGGLPLARGDVPDVPLESLLPDASSGVAAGAARPDPLMADLDARSARLLRQARAWSAEEVWRHAVPAYAELARRDPSSITLRIERARVLSWAGEPGEAAPLLESAARERSDPALALEAARSYWWAGEPLRADAMLERVLAASPADTSALRLRQEVRAAAEPPPELARRWAREGGPREQLILARALVRAGRYAEAIPAYRRGLAAAPEDSVYLELAAAAAATDSTAVRVEALEAFLARVPEDTLVRLQVARAHAWEGSYDAALAEYATLVREPAGPLALERARTLVWAGREAEAAAALDLYLTHDSTSAEAYRLRGDLERWGGNPAAAVASYRRALALDGPSAELTTSLAEAEAEAEAEQARRPAASPLASRVELATSRDSEGFRWLAAQATSEVPRSWGAFTLTLRQTFPGARRADGWSATSGYGGTAGARYRAGAADLSAAVGAHRYDPVGTLPDVRVGVAFEELVGAAVSVRVVHEPALTRAATLLALHARAMSTRVEASASVPVRDGSAWVQAGAERVDSRLGRVDRWSGAASLNQPLGGGLAAVLSASALATGGASPSLPGWGSLMWAPDSYVQALAGLRYSTEVRPAVALDVQAGSGYAWIRERPDGPRRFSADGQSVFQISADLAVHRSAWLISAGAAYGGALREGYRSLSARFQVGYTLPR